MSVRHSTTNIPGGHTNATDGAAGFMSAADKAKLNGVEAGAEVARDRPGPTIAVPGVMATPGWIIAGKAYMRTDQSRMLEVIVQLSETVLTARARLVRDDTLVEVAGSLLSVTGTTASTRLLSGALALAAGVIYQVQVECTGGTADAQFAMLYSARLN